VLRLRRATPDDGAFLAAMVLEAAFWRPDAARPESDEALRRPELSRYVADWSRPGDLGVVAEDEEPVGAAWWRHFTAADHGYGYVNSSVPELSMGVLPAHRGRGIGTALLAELMDRARERRLPALSLSVERDNPAARLYERAGFRTIREEDGSLTMVWKVPPLVQVGAP
jgi:ribosomal protein S18 acetylase RimI-like enzyme